MVRCVGPTAINVLSRCPYLCHKSFVHEGVSIPVNYSANVSNVRNQAYLNYDLKGLSMNIPQSLTFTVKGIQIVKTILMTVT